MSQNGRGLPTPPRRIRMATTATTVWCSPPCGSNIKPAKNDTTSQQKFNISKLLINAPTRNAVKLQKLQDRKHNVGKEWPMWRLPSTAVPAQTPVATAKRPIEPQYQSRPPHSVTHMDVVTVSVRVSLDTPTSLTARNALARETTKNKALRSAHQVHTNFTRTRISRLVRNTPTLHQSMHA